MNFGINPARHIVPVAHIYLPAVALAWAFAAAAGFVCLFNYQTSAGQSGQIPITFPASSRIEHTMGKRTLIMFAHARCPCTRASVGELAKIMARLQNKVQAYILFHVPENKDRQWATTDLVDKAIAIPGLQVVHDQGGLETRRFQVKTSGHVLLYDGMGRLSFSGGITGARGHHGDNEASKELFARVTQNWLKEPSEHVVFGCPILGELN